jgi:hypothetical protein
LDVGKAWSGVRSCGAKEDVDASSSSFSFSSSSSIFFVSPHSNRTTVVVSAAVTIVAIVQWVRRAKHAVKIPLYQATHALRLHKMAIQGFGAERVRAQQDAPLHLHAQAGIACGRVQR